MKKYFLKYYDFFISPIDVEKLYLTILELANNTVDVIYDEFSSVLNLLLEKGILIGSIQNESIQYPVCLVIRIWDFTNQKMGECVTHLLNDYFKENELTYIVKIEITDALRDNLSDSSPVPKEDNSQIDLIIPIFWHIELEKFEKICKLSANNSIILPVVCNYSYFSIGPQVCGYTSLNNAMKTLNREKKRYTYINYSPADCYKWIMVSFMCQEIVYIINELKGAKIKSRSKDEIITFHFESNTLKLSQYIYI